MESPPGTESLALIRPADCLSEVFVPVCGMALRDVRLSATGCTRGTGERRQSEGGAPLSDRRAPLKPTSDGRRDQRRPGLPQRTETAPGSLRALLRGLPPPHQGKTPWRGPCGPENSPLAVVEA